MAHSNVCYQKAFEVICTIERAYPKYKKCLFVLKNFFKCPISKLLLFSTQSVVDLLCRSVKIKDQNVSVIEGVKEIYKLQTNVDEKLHFFLIVLVDYFLP